MRFLLFTFHFLLFTFVATVSQALPTNTVRMATEAFVTNKVAIGVAAAIAQAETNTTSGLASKVSTNDATYLQTVSKAASAVQPAALGAYLPLSGGMMDVWADITFQHQYWLLSFGSVGPIGQAGFSYDGGPFGSFNAYLPLEERGDLTLATREWVMANASGGNVTSVFGRTGVVVAVTGDYTAAQVGALTAQETTNAIASASSANFIVRLTTNKLTNFTFTPTNATYFGDCSGSTLAPNGVINILAGTNGNYALAWGCTNTTFTTVQGSTANYEFYAYENETGDQTYKIEIYRRDVATGVMSEWGDGGPTFTIPTTGSPTLVTGSVYVPSVATNSFRIWARLKRVGGTATSLRNLYIGTGVGTPTHFDMTVPASVPIEAHNADASAHSNMMRSSLLWSAVGTNAIYQMSWDTTNGTFKVEEILP